MKTIPLTNGKVAIVDDEDYDRVSQFKWFYAKRGYAVRNIKHPDGLGSRGWTMQTMHRFILDKPEASQIDHISMDTLDNRRENLRIATKAQNMWNRNAPRNNTTGIKGVGFVAATGKWRATIAANGSHMHIGTFSTKEEAAMARQEAASRLHGEFAK